MDIAALKVLLDVCLHPAVIIDQDLLVVALNKFAEEQGFSLNSNAMANFSVNGDAEKQLKQCFKSSNKKHIRALLQNGDETDVMGCRLAGPFRAENLVMLQFTDTASARSHFIVTTVKNLEFKAKKAQQEANKANAAKSMFLANVSHEIRTPLHAISGLLELLSASELNEHQRDYIARANKSASLLAQLINDVLDISKIHAKQLQLEAIPFYLDRQLVELEGMFSDKAAAKGLDFKCEYKGLKNLPLRGDPIRIMQILINLCSNAFKFTKKGGVSVTVVQKKMGQEASFEVTVKDSGSGIEASFIPSMFNSFTQQNSTITRKFGGTGLGLAIVKELVVKMGGSINVSSTIGEGTEIVLCISFPVSNEKPHGEENTPSHKDTLKPLNILLVDDNDINLEIARSMLEQENHNLTTALNGQCAIECLEKQDFDFVFLDIQMPVMDGLTAIKLIRKQPRWKNLPIIALTANVLSNEVREYLASGFDGHLGKPFSKQALIDALRQHVQSYDNRQKTAS